jgi:uncharacterized protein (TIGR02246 family)
MFRFCICAALAVGLLAGCAANDSPDPAADRAAIREVLDQEVQAGSAGDADGFIAAFSDDATVIPPGAPAVSGDAFRQWARSFFEQVDVQVEYEDRQIILADDHAIHHYGFDWTITPKAGGEPLVESGEGLHILRRAEDGSWRITHDVWNAGPQPEG